MQIHADAAQMPAEVGGAPGDKLHFHWVKGMFDGATEALTSGLESLCSFIGIKALPAPTAASPYCCPRSIRFITLFSRFTEARDSCNQSRVRAYVDSKVEAASRLSRSRGLADFAASNVMVRVIHMWH